MSGGLQTGVGYHVSENPPSDRAVPGGRRLPDSGERHHMHQGCLLLCEWFLELQLRRVSSDFGSDFRRLLCRRPGLHVVSPRAREDGGSWGVICDDGWGASAAHVICRSLGFRSGKPTIKSRFGRSSQFYMDGVACGGSEYHLILCGFNGWGDHDCHAGEVAGAICHN